MGTNYYLHLNICSQCKRSEETKHIGKSSGGWCFSLHVEPEKGINDLEDWQKLFTSPFSEIRGEYGEIVTPEEMLNIITDRGREEKREKVPWGYGSWDEFHRHNYSESGPKGLVRAKVDGSHCIKHGEGTWDCIVGEFS